MDDECECEPDIGDEVELFLFSRACQMCGYGAGPDGKPDGDTWGSLHCPHDGIQNPCPECKWRLPGSRTAGEHLGFWKAPGAI